MEVAEVYKLVRIQFQTLFHTTYNFEQVVQLVAVLFLLLVHQPQPVGNWQLQQDQWCRQSLLSKILNHQDLLHALRIVCINLQLSLEVVEVEVEYKHLHVVEQHNQFLEQEQCSC